ncbi:MAG: NAD-dependent epimerase/dehydratase family protein, partial [bacterium]
EVLGLNSSTLDLTSPDSYHQIGKVVDKDTVIIFAIRASKRQDSLKAFEQDIAITGNVVRFLEKYPIKKLLYFSSISVYGEAVTDLCITEETKIAPLSHYGIAKVTAEALLRAATQEKGTPFIVLRPCMIYGPGNQQPPYGPDRLIHSLVQKGRVELFGDGSELRDFLFVKDLAQITEKFIVKDVSGIYNLGTGKNYSLMNIVEGLRALTQKEFPVIKLKRVKPKINQRLDISKLMKIIPDYSFTSLEKGLKQSYDSFQNINAQKNMGTVSSEISL